MKVVDLNGKSSKWKMTHSEGRGHRSKLHLSARAMLKKLYPTVLILEEVTINPRFGEALYLDFYIPLHQLCVEVHGQQHYKYSTMFHSSRADFLSQRKRDATKEEWCDINNIYFVALPYSEGIDEWRAKFG